MRMKEREEKNKREKNIGSGENERKRDRLIEWKRKREKREKEGAIEIGEVRISRLWAETLKILFQVILESSISNNFLPKV